MIGSSRTLGRGQLPFEGANEVVYGIAGQGGEGTGRVRPTTVTYATASAAEKPRPEQDEPEGAAGDPGIVSEGPIDWQHQ